MCTAIFLSLFRAGYFCSYESDLVSFLYHSIVEGSYRNILIFPCVHPDLQRKKSIGFSLFFCKKQKDKFFSLYLYLEHKTLRFFVS